MIVVVEINHLAQAERSGQTGRLGGDPLLHVAIGRDGVGVVVDDLMAWLVEACSQDAFRQRHADAVGETLAEWTRGGLDPWRHAHLRMAGRAGAPLPEPANLLQR